MGRVEAYMADLKYTVRRHAEVQGQYLGTFMAFAEDGSAHGADQHNPHDLSPMSVDLSHLRNYPIADDGEVTNPLVNDRYVDLLGARRSVEHRMSSIRVFDPVTPTSPIDAATVPTSRPTLKATGFRNRFGLNRLKREFRLTQQSTQETHTFSINHNDMTVPTDLDNQSMYQWQCRDVAVDGSASAWSYPWSFFVEAYEVQAPTILVVDEDPVATSLTPTFNTSPYPGDPQTDAHTDTHWRLILTATETVVWELFDSIGHLTSVRIPENVLAPGQTYRLEVNHVGRVNGPTPTGFLVFTSLMATTSPPSVWLMDNEEASGVSPTLQLSAFPTHEHQDTLVEIQVTVYDAGGPVWGRRYTEDPSTVTISRQLMYGTEYAVSVRWRGRHYGWSVATEVNFNTMAGGVHGYLTPLGTHANDVQRAGGFGVTANGAWVETSGHRIRSHRQGVELWRTQLTGDASFTAVLGDGTPFNALAIHIPENGSHRLLLLALGVTGMPSEALGSLEDLYSHTLSDPRFHGVWDGSVWFTVRSTSANQQGIIYAQYNLSSGVLTAQRLDAGDDSVLERSFYAPLNGKQYGGYTVQYQNTQGVVHSKATGCWVHDEQADAFNAKVAYHAPNSDPTSPKELGVRVVERRTDTDELVIDRGDEVVVLDKHLTIPEWWAMTLRHPDGRVLPMRSPVGSGTTPHTAEIGGSVIGMVSAGVATYTNNHLPQTVMCLCTSTDIVDVVYTQPHPTGLKAVMRIPEPINRLWYVDHVDANTITEGEPFMPHTEYAWVRCEVEATPKVGSWPTAQTLTRASVTCLSGTEGSSVTLFQSVVGQTTTDPLTWGTLTYIHE